MDVKIAEGWKTILEDEFKQEYFHQIVDLLRTERLSNQRIFPPGPLIFNAFNTTDFDDVQVVILGQDPYHGAGQAHGLSFSVQNGTKPPPSLVNIYKEIEQDLGVHMNRSLGDLTSWAKQGVLLLNASLTVRENQPNSHAGIGWHQFTDAVIQLLSQKRKGIVFLLWGNFAKEKAKLIDPNKHLILTAAHPSPFSVEKGFYGCRHFSKTNAYLVSKGKDPIDWLINHNS